VIKQHIQYAVTNAHSGTMQPWWIQLAPYLSDSQLDAIWAA